MPRYYFDLNDSHGITVDEEGMELRDFEAAQNEAGRALGSMARDAASSVIRSGIEQMEIGVRDEAGPLMAVRFLFEVSRDRKR